MHRLNARKHTPELKEQAVALYAELKSYAEVGRRMKIGEVTAHRWIDPEFNRKCTEAVRACEQRGVSTTKRRGGTMAESSRAMNSKKTAERVLLAIQLRAEGWKYSRIAKMFNIHQKHIRRWLDPDYNEWCRKQQKESRARVRERVCVRAVAPPPRRNVPTMPYVRCLEGKRFNTFQMVRP